MAIENSKQEKISEKIFSFIISWQEWRDSVRTDIFEQVTKLEKPMLHDGEEKEIREILNDAKNSGLLS